MVLSAFGILTAGLARVPLEFIRNRDISTIFLMGDIFALVYISHDTLTHKRLHPVPIVLLVRKEPASWIKLPQPLRKLGNTRDHRRV